MWVFSQSEEEDANSTHVCMERKRRTAAWVQAGETWEMQWEEINYHLDPKGQYNY